MKRLLAVLIAVALLGTGGCGKPEFLKSGREQYCDAVQADQAKLGDMVNSGRSDALIDGLPLLRSLAAKAPDDLTDEWQTFVNAVAGLHDALDAAGLSSADVRNGLPASVTGKDRADIKAAATRLGSTEVLSAVDGIETEARDVCKVNIGV